MEKTGRYGMMAALLTAVAIAALAPRPAGAQERVAEESLRRALTAAAMELQTELADARQAIEFKTALADARTAMAPLDFATAELDVELTALRSRLAATRARTFERRTRWAPTGVGGASPLAALPELSFRQDPADSLYRQAREALNGGRYDRAAELFGEIRDDHPRSSYVPESFYFEALALLRAGGTRKLRRALELLEVQRTRYTNARTAEEARALQVRIEGELARGGDAASAVSIQARATADCETDEQELRSAALGALLQMDADRATPILREVLRSRDECSAELRKRAVFMLAQKMTPETVDILLELAHRNPDPDPEVREAAVFWLSQVRSEEALEALSAILEESDDPGIQEKAIFAISQHQGDAASAALRAYAQRSAAPADLREKAIFWIGQSGDEEASSYLRGLYDRLDDPELREKVIFGVAQSPTEEDRRWLLDLALDSEEPLELRKTALFWAGQSGRIGGADLKRLYETMPDREMREQVVFALAHEGTEEGVTALMEIAREEEDTKLRERAIFWLGQSDDPRVPEFLLELVRGGGR